MHNKFKFLFYNSIYCILYLYNKIYILLYKNCGFLRIRIGFFRIYIRIRNSIFEYFFTKKYFIENNLCFYRLKTLSVVDF